MKRAGDNVKRVARDKAPLVAKTLFFSLGGSAVVMVAGAAMATAAPAVITAYGPGGAST